VVVNPAAMQTKPRESRARNYQLHVRANDRELAVWRAACQHSGMSISEVAREALNRYAQETLGESALQRVVVPTLSPTRLRSDERIIRHGT
jgi:hypothetical protein